MKIGITVGVVIAILALVACFVPLKEVAYTATEPLSYQETGFVEKEQRPNPDPRSIHATIEFSKDLEDVTAALKQAHTPKVECPVGYVGVVNRDIVSGTFTVHFTFYSSGEQYSKDVTLQLRPDELGGAKYQATSIDANEDEWSWEYKVTPDTKMVTNYKKVTLITYYTTK